MTGAAQPACWVLTPGHAGMENQAVGLAEAVGLPFLVKRVRPRAPWTWLPVACWPWPLAALGPDSDPVAPPWPALLIACGRRSVPYSLYVRRASGGACFTVQIQDPRVAPARFDLVTAPRHDGVMGPNVVPTLGSLTRLGRRDLAAAAAAWAERVGHLPRPLVAVLVGGPSRAYRMTPDVMRTLASRLKSLGAGLLVTPSRRTGPRNLRALEEGLAGAPALIWDFTGENPYAAFLGLADAVVVTCDSVNMATDALLTGKPVYLAELPGGGRRLAAFHRSLYDGGYARPFAGRIESWSYAPVEETARVAAEIERLLAARAPASSPAARRAAS